MKDVAVLEQMPAEGDEEKLEVSMPLTEVADPAAAPQVQTIVVTFLCLAVIGLFQMTRRSFFCFFFFFFSMLCF